MIPLMKFLKVLVNGLISGLFLSGLIALLIHDLNIQMNFQPDFLGRATLALMISYGLLTTLTCVILFFFIQFFSGRTISIAALSPGFLMLSFSMLILVFMLVFRENMIRYSSFFQPESAGLLRTQSLTLIFLAVLGLLFFSGYVYSGKKVLFAGLYFILFGSAITYSVYQRSLFPHPPEHKKTAQLSAENIDRRVTIIGMPGLSLDFLLPMTQENKLPNFSWMMNEGSWGKLESFTPCREIVLDSSFNTGKLPSKHLCLNGVEYRLLDMQAGIQVPPCFLFFGELDRLSLLSVSRISPRLRVKDIWDIFRAHGSNYLKLEMPRTDSRAPIPPEAETIFTRFYQDLRFETSEPFRILKQSFCADVVFENQAAQERSRMQPQLFHFQLRGLSVAETYFYKYNFPELFGEIDQEELNRYSTVIEQYYKYYDEIIGRYAAAKKDNELLIVFSSHGIEPLPVWKRYLEWMLGNSEVSAHYENAPDGVFFFVGEDIAPRQVVDDMRLIDIAPTLLHYLGLPLGKDMDGIVNSSMFRDEFKREPVLFISSYEEHEIKSPH